MTSRSARLVSVLAAAGVLGTIDGASAAEPLALTWHAPPECPQQAAVRARIDALVPAASTSKERLEADGRIERVDGRFRLTLEMRVGEVSGERQIESDSCKDLAGAAAVALGLMLQSAEPEGATGTGSGALSGEPDTAAAAGSSAQTKPTTPRPASPTPAAREPEEWRDADDAETEDRERDKAPPREWAVLLHGPLLALDVGQMPQPHLGGAFGAGLALRDWRFSVDFQVGQKQSVSVSGEPRLQADVSRLAIEGWFCRSWRAEPFAISPCLTVGWERVSAEGTGAGVASQTTRASFVSAGAGAFGHLFLTDFLAFMLGVGGRIEGARPHILVEDVGEVEQLGAAAFWLKTGPEWIF